VRIEIDSVIIVHEKLKAVVRLEHELGTGGMNPYETASKIERMVMDRAVEKIAQDILLQRGPEIYAKITDNQIVNAVLVRLASNMGNRE
jgi:hypothetical protein